jgi:hypothetical protein
MAGTGSMDPRHFSRNVSINPLVGSPDSSVDIFLSPIALRGILCDLFGSDKLNPSFICLALNGRNLCFCFLADYCN